jgi:hypothetical protein
MAMWPPDQADDGGLEVTPLDGRAAQRLHARRFTLGRRGRVALAVCAIALAVLAPLASLPSIRAAFAGLFPTPTPPTVVENASLSIVSVSTAATTDIAPSAWARLRARPLRLPSLAPGATCPAAQGRVVQPGFGPAIGDGPAYIVGMGTDGVLQATGPAQQGPGSATWGGQFTMFVIAPHYHGPVLARGHQLDGSHALLFNGGLDQLNGFDQSTPTLLSQLRLDGDPAYGAPWPNFPALLRMQAPGCYGIQLDGDTFSEVMVFRVVFGT